MKTHQIAFEHTGVGRFARKTPARVYIAGAVDLTDKVAYYQSIDDGRSYLVDRWEVRAVLLPDWLSPEEWIARSVPFKCLWGMGASKDWSESWQRGLLALETTERYAAIQLLATKTFRSAFRKSQRDQIVAWLETAPEVRKDASPLSTRQWEAALGPYGAREAKRAS